MSLQERVKAYLEQLKKDDRGISQAAFAKRIGISDSTLSRWLLGSYTADATNIESKVADYLDKEAERCKVREAGDIRFAMTGISQSIWATLDYCRVQKQIVCIYGDAGCGKTMTAREWMKDKENILFLTASPAINSQKAVLKRFARLLKTKSNGNKDDLEYEIIEKLEGTDITIIIDEAQHFNINTLEMIRSIKESGNVGLALIGNAMIYDRLTGKLEAQFAQLFSRLMLRKHVLTDQFNLLDMEKVFGALGEPELQYMLDVARSRYGLRGANFLYMNAANNENTTKGGLKAMAQSMGILV